MTATFMRQQNNAATPNEKNYISHLSQLAQRAHFTVSESLGGNLKALSDRDLPMVLGPVYFQYCVFIRPYTTLTAPDIYCHNTGFHEIDGNQKSCNFCNSLSTFGHCVSRLDLKWGETVILMKPAKDYSCQSPPRTRS